MFAAAISLVGLAATVYLVLREAKAIRALSGTVAKSALGWSVVFGPTRFVEENLDDLISKIKLLENNSLLYENIRKGGAVLVENYFTKEYIISYLKNTIMKRM